MLLPLECNITDITHKTTNDDFMQTKQYKMLVNEDGLFCLFTTGKN